MRRKGGLGVAIYQGPVDSDHPFGDHSFANGLWRDRRLTSILPPDTCKSTALCPSEMSHPCSSDPRTTSRSLAARVSRFYFRKLARLRLSWVAKGFHPARLSIPFTGNTHGLGVTQSG